MTLFKYSLLNINLNDVSKKKRKIHNFAMYANDVVLSSSLDIVPSEVYLISQNYVL